MAPAPSWPLALRQGVALANFTSWKVGGAAEWLAEPGNPAELVALAAWAQAQAERRNALRPCPDPSLLDLHLALHFARRCNADHQIDFLGRSRPIGPTQRHSVSVIHHPNRQFWVASTPPKPPENRGSDVLAKYFL